jgi:hypothetical protein
MGKRTWACVPCRKMYRRKQSLTSVECPNCLGPCDCVDSYLRIPSPKQTKLWDEFWVDYKAQKEAQKALLEASHRVAEEGIAKRRRRLATAEKRVGYLEGICTPLIKTLKHAAELPVNQLAGHAANVDFWIGETKHALMVIDGYQERFARLRTGQAEYEKQDNVAKTGPLRRSSKSTAREKIRRELCEALERFLSRCHREGLLTEKNLQVALNSLGIYYR